MTMASELSASVGNNALGVTGAGTPPPASNMIGDYLSASMWMSAISMVGQTISGIATYFSQSDVIDTQLKAAQERYTHLETMSDIESETAKDGINAQMDRVANAEKRQGSINESETQLTKWGNEVKEAKFEIREVKKTKVMASLRAKSTLDAAFTKRDAYPSGTPAFTA